MNKSYSAETKFFILRTQLKEDISQKQFAQKKQSEYSLMKCLKEASVLFFNRSYFNDCFKYDVTDHLLKYCSEI